VFTLRLVVLEATGRPGIILERRSLKARTLADAKAEADSQPRAAGDIQATAFEIIDDHGVTVAQRRLPGVHARWSSPDQS
jgi:hypothetical protein